MHMLLLNSWAIYKKSTCVAGLDEIPVLPVLFLQLPDVPGVQCGTTSHVRFTCTMYIR